ncbi:hypothetical protein I4U23_031197 [Adineta vaga]|nr:hypothetical protein I4U23_031197 [Adineta vaga]
MDSDNDSGNSNEGPIHRRRTQGTRPLPSSLHRISSSNNNNDRSYQPTKDESHYSDDDDEVDEDEDEDDRHQSTYRGRGRPSQQQHLMDNSYDDGNDHQDLPRYTGPLREQDRFLPIANIAKIMKKGVPEKGKIAKDAKETIQECVSEFISFITSEASDRCLQEKRKTINGEDILLAMLTLGFDSYVEPLRTFLTKVRDASKYDRTITMGGELPDDIRLQVPPAQPNQTQVQPQATNSNGLEPYGNSVRVVTCIRNDQPGENPNYINFMDELSFLIESLINSEIDDMILDLVYEIHSSIKGIPQDDLSINNHENKRISIEKQTCICPNCGQTNLVAIRFAYHLAKCLGAGRQSSRQAQRRIIDQIMIITDSDENRSNGNHFYKDIETNSISEDGSSCTDSTSSSMTLSGSHKTHLRVSNEDKDYLDEFDNDEEEEWKPKKKKRRPKATSTTNKKKKKDLLLVVSPATTKLDCPNYIIPYEKLRTPVTKHAVIPFVPLPISSVGTPNSDRIFFRNHPVSSDSSHYFVQSPLSLVDDDQSSIIIFKEDINN